MPRLLPFAVCMSFAAAQVEPAPAPESPAGPSPIEFGKIAWQRDFAAARASARSQQLPRLVLFQEVPG